MDAYIYNRVSTDDKGQNKDSNLLTCQEFCKFNNLNVKGILLDEGITGNSYYYDRDKGKELALIVEKYVSESKPLIIVVFSMDRFTRQLPFIAMTLLMELLNKNIYVWSVSENVFNEHKEYSDLLWYIILWNNNYFLKQLSDKVKASLDKRKAEGKESGRKRKANYQEIYDYYVEHNLNVRNKDKKIGLRAIAREFKVSPSSVSNAIKCKGLSHIDWEKKQK